jgi:glyoxylase-like metal-dependent hydrolase (beta-lactamase superfamily II)
MSTPVYQVHAVRYATVERRAIDNFLMRDAHDGLMPLDFFFWVIRGDGRTIVVDTGFSAHSARRRNRTLLCTPAEGLAALGITPQEVADVVLTHLHFDHAGNTDAFPAARFHLQDAEMRFATGRCMCHPALSHFFEVEDVTELVRKVYAGRVEFHDGDAELAPGITLHKVGGHTEGLQIVRVYTARGWIVLASDAAHYYRNLEDRNPFPGILDVGQMLEGYRRIERLADSAQHIVPGHDPEVRSRYPVARHGDIEIATLHEPPTC